MYRQELARKGVDKVGMDEVVVIGKLRMGPEVVVLAEGIGRGRNEHDFSEGDVCMAAGNGICYMSSR